MTKKNRARLINILYDPKTIAGVLISILGIYWAFKDFKFMEFSNSIKEINYLYLLLGTLSLWSSVWFRAIRWRYLFEGDKLPTTASLYRSELMGYFGNNVLPLRLGELMRVYLTGREWNIPKSYVFGTIVLERVLDIFSLAGFACYLIIFYPLVGYPKEFILYVCGIIIIVIISIAILRYINKLRGNHKILIILKQIINGLSSIKKDALFPVIVLSFFIWGIYGVNIYLIQCAFHFDLSIIEVLLLLVLSSLAISIPSAPGMIGTFHAAVKFCMVDLFGFTPHDGNSFAIILHAYGYILFTVLGAYYFLKNQFHDQIFNSVISDSNNFS